MKTLNLSLLLFLSAYVLGQNWSPILVNEEMNYQHCDSTYISHTIWVDSANYSGYDSIFYLNRVVKDVPGNPEIVLRNQPQFLMEFMVQQNYGIYSFHYPFNYSLSTGLPLGATWIFDLTNIVDAEITACYEEEIFGVLDSVKMISLSDGSEILLSKNFGILKFPDFENGGYFELVGIQGTAYGESVPGFWEIFDFEVGDVFQFNFVQGETTEYWHETQKFLVQDKVVSSNNIEYQFKKIIDGLYIDYFGGSYFYSYSTEVSNSYYDSLNHPCNNYNNELVVMWEDYSGTSIEDFPFSKTILHKDSIGNTVKKMGGNFDNGLYHQIDPFNDTLQQDGDYDHFITYTEGLGVTVYNYFCFEQMVGYSIQGYIKDGDTVGIITPDSLLLVGVESNQINRFSRFVVFPNPATEWLNIKQSNPNYTYNFELRNLYGQLLKEEKNIHSSYYNINISDFKPGIYFYVIKEKEKVVQQGKLIKK